MAAVISPLQVLLGDHNGLVVARYQPTKLAALEAHWETNDSGGAGFVVFGIPDELREMNHLEVKIPHLLSLLVTRSWDNKVLGLKEFPRAERPPVAPLFFSFRVMVGIGLVLLVVSWVGGFMLLRGKLWASRRMLWCLVGTQPLGFLATWLGWIVTEVGRQPWVVYGIMRTRDGVSPIEGGVVLGSLVLFGAVCVAIGGSYFWYVLRTLSAGPDLTTPIPPLQRPAGMIPMARSPQRG
jgi:cytochrome d ubiquinol oxidase subunit I